MLQLRRTVVKLRATPHSVFRETAKLRSTNDQRQKDHIARVERLLRNVHAKAGLLKETKRKKPRIKKNKHKQTTETTTRTTSKREKQRAVRKRQPEQNSEQKREKENQQ